MSDIIRDLQLPRCPRHPRPAPGPRAVPTPLSSTPVREARERCKPGRRPPAPNLSRQPLGPPRGLHARLDSGPAGSATQGLAGPGPPSLLPASARAPPGGRGAPGEPPDAWVPGPSAPWGTGPGRGWPSRPPPAVPTPAPRRRRPAFRESPP